MLVLYSSPYQWGAIAEAIQAGGHLPFFDVAYQGFASGDLDQGGACPILLVMSSTSSQLLLATSPRRCAPGYCSPRH
jgi:aspartate/tyrosine/aromatic aminotransferase